MRNIKAAWLWFWRLPYWVSLIVSISLFGWSHFDKVQRDQVRQQQKIELDSIALAQDKLGQDIDRYQIKYSALFVKKEPLTKEEKAKIKVAETELKTISAQIDLIKRRLHEICGSEN